MEVTRLFDFLYYQQENFPQEKSFGYRRNGGWQYFSTAEMIDMANKVSLGLLTKLGVKPGDKIVLVTEQNRPEWVVMDIGMQQVGAINVPVYPTISQREYEYIFNEAEVKYCFCGGAELVQKVSKTKENVPSLAKVFSFDEVVAPPESGGEVPFWKSIWAEGSMSEVEKIKATIKPDDLATIIYTSGTTGNPKGVMLSHHNIVSNIKAVAPIVPVTPGDRALSFLPLNHSFERAVAYAYMYFGVSVTFTGTDNLGGEHGDFQAIKPHIFTTVPRLLEKVYEKIYNKGLELRGLKRMLFFWALSLTDDYEFGKKYNGWAAFKRRIAGKLVFSKWRAALGGHMKGIVTGASACPVKIARIFSAAGIPVREGYGLTETSPALTISRFEEDGALPGAVGPVLDGIKLMIDASDGNYRPGEGEVLAQGPNIMMGYYKKPEATADVFKEINGERWFCTGDIGKFVPGPGGRQYLKITDRKKALLKTSGGKYVAPQPIESALQENFLIEQVMVIGEQRKFVSALIVPAVAALRDWCGSHGVPFTTMAGVLQNEKVRERYQRIVDKCNPLFSHVEQVKKFQLLDATWEPVKADGTEGELTPTMKLKRRVIMEKYATEIEAMYA
ncbi:MAG: long-chain fatty acid--CoA ligase [Saprospiraceae bacterium]|nr:MAG: long-chain fatty acid--CoA ligase [Saprospiraceae bacterium]